MTRHRTAVRLGTAVVVLLVLAIGGCSVSTNDEPQAAGNLFATLLETTTTTSTSVPTEEQKTERLYFLETVDSVTRLRFTERSFDVGADVEEVLRNLFTAPPDTEGTEPGLTTAIPADAVLAPVSFSDTDPTMLIVDVGGLFGSVDGTRLRNALAQIVLTATESRDVRSVSFRRNGEPTTAIVGNDSEVERPVVRSDYTNLL